jgi:hypothetical protein
MRLDTPTRKTDLAGMIAQMGGALRQQHGMPALVQHDRKEHGSRRQRLVASAIFLNKMPGLGSGNATAEDELSEVIWTSNEHAAREHMKIHPKIAYINI